MQKMNHNVALYIRLSVADQETGISKNESSSILGQRNYINQYLDRHEELKDYNRIEYIDDGFTGTNDKRPKFQEMLEDVKHGYINAICIKDTSRFFRDYTEAGNYIECVFPFLGVRFISVNDNYDSDNYKGTTGSFELAIRNIVYASYSKDLSIKLQKAYRHLSQEGKYVRKMTAYGYIKHPSEQYKVVVDPVASQVVRKIFDYAIEGFGTVRIAEKLNEEGIVPPGEYFGTIYPQYKNFANLKGLSWKHPAIHKILNNEIYIGTMVCCKRGKDSFYAKPKAREPLKIANAHEPIVTIEEFKQAQQVIQRIGEKKPKEVKIREPLRRMVFCVNCKNSLHLKESNFVCHQSISNNCCSQAGKRLTIPKEEVEKKVIGHLKAYISLMNERAEMEKESQKKRDFKKQRGKNYHLQLRKCERERESVMREKTLLYEQYVDEHFSKAVYLEKRKWLDEKVLEIDELMVELREDMEHTEVVGVATEEKKNVFEMCRMYANFQELTYELTHDLIDKIYVRADGEMEIRMKFEV
ncbi:MAG: recombinase family protein [Bacillota bacterium]